MYFQGESTSSSVVTRDPHEVKNARETTKIENGINLAATQLRHARELLFILNRLRHSDDQHGALKQPSISEFMHNVHTAATAIFDEVVLLLPNHLQNNF